MPTNAQLLVVGIDTQSRTGCLHSCCCILPMHIQSQTKDASMKSRIHV